MDHKKIIIVSLLSAVFFLGGTSQTLAEGKAMISIRLDDGLTTQYTNGREILSKYGLPATLYAFTDPLQEGNWEGYMTWPQLKQLYSTYGWEIGNHTKSHPNMTTLSTVGMNNELILSQYYFNRQGINPKTFALPFGAYNNTVLSQVIRYFENSNLADYGFNEYPYNDYGLFVQEVRGTTSVSTVKGWIDQAIAGKKWLVLLFHGIVDSEPGEYDCTKANFEEIVKYIKNSGAPVVKISDALKISVTNLVKNPSFEQCSLSWPLDWSRNNTNNVRLNRCFVGNCYSRSANTIQMTGGTGAYRLYTKNYLDIDPAKQYAVKVFFNCTSFSSGGIDVYLDEYDANGKWLNWSWKTGLWNGFVGYKTAIYTPNPSARKLMLWIESAPNSNLKCYVDNVMLFETGSPSGNAVVPLVPIQIQPPLTLPLGESASSTETVL